MLHTSMLGGEIFFLKLLQLNFIISYWSLVFLFTAYELNTFDLVINILVVLVLTIYSLTILCYKPNRKDIFLEDVWF